VLIASTTLFREEAKIQSCDLRCHFFSCRLDRRNQ
jgi:hypothetical protein